MGQRILKISGQLFPQLFSDDEKHYRAVKDPVPTGARIVMASFDSSNVAIFTLESSEWSDVPEGDQIPEIKPQFQAIRSEDFGQLEAENRRLRQDVEDLERMNRAKLDTIGRFMGTKYVTD